MSSLRIMDSWKSGPATRQWSSLLVKPASFNFKALGSFWLIVGAIGIVELVVQLRPIWSTQYILSQTTIGTLPFLFLSGHAIANGWGLLSRKRGGRPATIVLSLILILYSLVSPFIIEWQYSALPWLISVLLFMMGSYGLWLMLSKRGKEAFKLYVS